MYIDYNIKVSLINLNLEEEEKVLSGTFVSLSKWDDTIVLGSETVQCVNIKKWDWKLSFQATVSSDVSNNGSVSLHCHEQS